MIGVLAWLILATAVRAQSPVQPFLVELNRELQSGDRTAVASRMRYPVIVSIGGIRMPFQSSGSLVERYDDIFTRELRDLLSRTPAIVETPEGFSVATNLLSIVRVGAELKIAGIVVPPSEARAVPAVPREPRRIGLRAGPNPTRFAGLLPTGVVDTYIVFVPKGQLLDVRLERVRGEALVRVASAETGAPLNQRGAQGALVVSGRAAAGGDYRIEVERTSAGDADLPYTLAVTMR